MINRAKKNTGIWLAIFLGAGASVALIPERIKAVFTEEQAVHIEADKIENSTLLIGTHLIYMGSMTEYVYEIAQKSAEESRQRVLYYKSELGDGAWYSLSDASSLKDITTKGKAVPAEEIQKLYVTHHTKADGVTYDLRTDHAVSVYEIEPPYELRSMRELTPIANQEKLDQKGKSLFELEAEDEQTQLCDSWIQVLQAAKMQLAQAAGTKEQLALMDSAMEKADALRRNIVYEKVEKKIAELIDEVGAADADFNSAAAQSLAQIEDSLRDSEGKMLDDGTTVMTKAEASLIRQLITASGGVLGTGDSEDPGQGEQKKADITTCDAVLSQLVSLQHILDGQTASKEAELRLLTELLIPMAEAAYKSNPTEAARNELDYYQKQKADRENPQEAGLDVLNSLYDKREELKEQHLSALDSEKLKEAKHLEALIEEVDSQIKEKELAISSDAVSLQHQKAEAQSQLLAARKEGSATAGLEQQIAALDSKINQLGSNMNEGSQSENIISMGKMAEAAISEGTAGLERLSEAVAGIGAMCGSNPGLAGSTLKNLYQQLAAEEYLRNTKEYEGVLGRIEELLADNKSIISSDIGQEEAVNTASEAAKGDKNAALLGLALFCEQSAGSGLEALPEKQATLLSQQKDSYVFPKVKQEGSGQFIAADAAARFGGFRYIWNENKKQATLASRKDYYIFTAFDTVVTRKGNREDTLSVPASFQSVIYIPADYAQQQFGCEVYNIAGTEYCMLIDESISDKAADVLDALSTKGEQ